MPSAPEPSAPDDEPVSRPRYARVIVEVEPAHLDRLFDYRIPEDATVTVGSRVEVVFSGRRVRGLVAEVDTRTGVPTERIRELRRVLGEHAWATPEEIELFRWAGERFAAPTADVVRHALPRRVVAVERDARERGWFDANPRDESAGSEVDAPREWERYAGGTPLWQAATRDCGSFYWRPLPGEDVGRRIVELAGSTLQGGRDVLLVVPEPVSSVADALREAFTDHVVDVRGDVSTRALYRAWIRARTGRARVVIGERGVAFWPLERTGLGIVLDESSPALKERRSPRHHAREVVLERCRRARATGLLVGTVPGAEGWRLLARRRVRSVIPPRDEERHRTPIVIVDDGRDPRSIGRIGTAAMTALRDATTAGRLGVLVAARRGEGRALVCQDCGLLLTCPRCASSLATSGGDGRATVLCEGCGWSDEQVDGRRRCERCGSDGFVPLAAGAERLGHELRRMFPDVRVAVLEGYARDAPDPPAIIVATRGSVLADAPGDVGAVVLPDFDGQLRRPVLDAAEDTLRVAMRAASWLARPGESRSEDRTVVVQAEDAGNHAVQALVRWDPGGFWRREVERRAELRFPPVAHAIRLDTSSDPSRLASDLRENLPDGDEVLGPRLLDDRHGFLVKSDDRTATVAALDPLRRRWSKQGQDVRVDVDPVDVS